MNFHQIIKEINEATEAGELHEAPPSLWDAIRFGANSNWLFLKKAAALTEDEQNRLAAYLEGVKLGYAVRGAA